MYVRFVRRMRKKKYKAFVTSTTLSSSSNDRNTEVEHKFRITNRKERQLFNNLNSLSAIFSYWLG